MYCFYLITEEVKPYVHIKLFHEDENTDTSQNVMIGKLIDHSNMSEWVVNNLTEKFVKNLSYKNVTGIVL